MYLQRTRQNETGGTVVHAGEAPGGAHQVAVARPMIFQLQQITINLAGFPPPGFIWWTDLIDETER